MDIDIIITVLVEDIGMDRVLEDNDITEEDLMEHLINNGLIDLQLYQLVEEDE